MMEYDNHKDKDESSNEDCSLLQRNRGLLDFPDEILEFIFSYVPPYSDLDSCKQVCKRWNFIIKNLIRRTKINLHKGLQDFGLQWEIFPLSRVQATSGSLIAGRFSHSAVRHNNSMYIFGGGSATDTTFNDLWRFDLSNLRWERALSMGSYPSPKGSASMVSWRDQLVLFGGWRYPSLHPPYQPWCLFDELHYYDLAQNRWTLHNIPTIYHPPPMAGHSATVHCDRMVIYGGYQISEEINSNSNETWCLDLKGPTWWQPRLAGNVKPQPRYGQYQLKIDDEHLLIVGGCGGPNNVYSDAWLLDMSGEIWSWREIPVRNKNFAASHMWCNPACKIGSKLVVLGPTPNMPNRNMMRQRVLGGSFPSPSIVLTRGDNNREFYLDRPGQPLGLHDGAGLRANVYLRLVDGLPVQLEDNFEDNASNRNNRNTNHNHNHNSQPRTGSLRNLRGPSTSRPMQPEEQEQRQQRRSFESVGNDESANPILPELQGDSPEDEVVVFQAPPDAECSLDDLADESRLYRIENGRKQASRDARSRGRISAYEAGKAAARNRANSPEPEPDADNDGIEFPRICPAREPAHSWRRWSSSDRSIKIPDIEAANRLQRNLSLRRREHEPYLPKRFDELHEDRFRMAAFNVQSPSGSKDHNERMRRLEEKVNAIRNARRPCVQPEPKCIEEPTFPRIRRNVLSLFVCDLSSVLDAEDPHISWLPHKNYGVLPGAPERLILSTMVSGHGELILFGGVHKETLSDITHQVSNTIHFLNAPHDIC